MLSPWRSNCSTARRSLSEVFLLQLTALPWTTGGVTTVDKGSLGNSNVALQPCSDLLNFTTTCMAAPNQILRIAYG
jgi:hypothetical protein